jgi:hypothetical protein
MRGNFAVTIVASYDHAILSASYGGGYREDEIIFPRLLRASLNYSALTPVTWTLEDLSTPTRLQYLWDFFCTRKENGNEPFLMQDPREQKWFLWCFEDSELEYEMLHFHLATAGLKVKQVYVRGVTPDNADGSFDEE